MSPTKNSNIFDSRTNPVLLENDYASPQNIWNKYNIIKNFVEVTKKITRRPYPSIQKETKSKLRKPRKRQVITKSKIETKRL